MIKRLLVIASLAVTCFGAPVYGPSSFSSFQSGDGLNEWNSAGLNVLINPHSEWATYTGAKWVSDTNSGVGGVSVPNNQNTPMGTFFESFFLPYNLNSVTLFVWADDTVLISINGTVIENGSFSPGPACANKAPGCKQDLGGSYAIGNGFLHKGDNILQFDVFQLWGDTTGLMYVAESFSTNVPPDNPSEVPEMSTWAMALSGLVLISFGKKR